MWTSGCNLSYSSWYLVKISVMNPCKHQKNNKYIIQGLYVQACGINQQSTKKYPSAVMWIFFNAFLSFLFLHNESKIKVCHEMCMCSEKVKHTIQVVTITNLSLTPNFRVTMINYKHIPSVLYSPIFPACSISRAEVQQQQQQQLGRCWEVFLS